MPPAHELTAPSPRVPALSVPRVAVRYRVALAVLALTALTFLIPSAPTYDPWAWIVWGREILHLDLSTVDGPSWKPLPVLLTTPFALFGGLAPDLWLFVARAGAIAGVVMAFRVARRLGGVPAGAAAAGAYAVAPWMLRNSALGNSEGLLVALGLAAVDRHLAGRTRHAFLFGIGAALLRPEAWPLIGLYGLWLFWRDPGARKLVAAAFVSLPLLWLLPELWGSGDLLRAAHRAHNPRANSAAFSDDPIREVVRQFGTMLTPALWIGLGALVAMMALRLGSGRRERRAAVGLALAAAVWVGEVAVMTNDGFSGNARYLIMPAAVACVLAGTGIGWLVRALPARWFASGVAVAALSVVAAIVFAAPSVGRLDAVRASVYYQARLTDGLAGAIAQAGGPDRLKACGTAYTGAFQVPSVAWLLNEHTTSVRSASAPGDAPPQVPAVVLRSRTTSQQPPGSRDREHRRRGGRADVRDLRRLAHRGELRMSATAPTVARPGRASHGWAPRAWPSACPKSLLVLAFLVGLSLALRTQAIHARFWIDEGLSVGISSHPLGDIPGVLRKDGSPPLYYLILKLWMSVFGSGEADTHALSVAFAIFTVPAAWLGGRALFGDRAAWIAALLAAINPFLTYYSQETRMYALVALLSTIVTATFVVDLRPGPARVAARLLGGAGAHRLRPQLGPVPGHRDGGGARADLPPGRRPARGAARRAPGLRDHRGALPAVAADPDLPGPAHRRAVGGAADLPGHPQRPRQHARRRRAGDGLRARRGLRAQHDPRRRAALAARPRGAVGGDHGPHDAGGRVAGLTGLAGVVEPLLLGLHRARCCCSAPPGWRAAAAWASSSSRSSSPSGSTRGPGCSTRRATPTPSPS